MDLGTHVESTVCKKNAVGTTTPEVSTNARAYTQPSAHSKDSNETKVAPGYVSLTSVWMTDATESSSHDAVGAVDEAAVSSGLVEHAVRVRPRPSVNPNVRLTLK
jgi:hypothetical protein